MTDPLLLRVRDPADLAQQQHYHRVNALAYSLTRSILVPVLTVPQTIPHGTLKGNVDGAPTAASYSRVVERLQEIELEARAFPLDWERQERLEAERERLTLRRDRLNAELAAIRSSGRGTRAGVPGLYSVKVPAIRYTGGVEGECAEERHTLDTRTLPDDLRTRLDVFLASGSEALPYRYRTRNYRYEAQNMTSADLRDLYRTLFTYAVPVHSPSRLVSESISLA